MTIAILFGPMVLVRSPLASSGNAYLQVAGGVYVFGGGISPRAKYPACFLEAECAPSRMFCLSLGMERVDYEYPYGLGLGYDRPVRALGWNGSESKPEADSALAETGSALSGGFHLAHDLNGDRFGPKAVWRHGDSRGRRHRGSGLPDRESL